MTLFRTVRALSVSVALVALVGGCTQLFAKDPGSSVDQPQLDSAIGDQDRLANSELPFDAYIQTEDYLHAEGVAYKRWFAECSKNLSNSSLNVPSSSKGQFGSLHVEIYGVTSRAQAETTGFTSGAFAVNDYRNQLDVFNEFVEEDLPSLVSSEEHEAILENCIDGPPEVKLHQAAPMFSSGLEESVISKSKAEIDAFRTCLSRRGLHPPSNDRDMILSPYRPESSVSAEQKRQAGIHVECKAETGLVNELHKHTVEFRENELATKKESFLKTQADNIKRSRINLDNYLRGS